MSKKYIDINIFQEKCVEFLNNNPLNYINESNAVRSDLIGMKIFDSPVFAFGNAKDKLFEKLKNNEVVNDEYMLPHDWLENCESVISYFLPFTKEIRIANKEKMNFSDEWGQGRIEGQVMLNQFSAFIISLLKEYGYNGVAPSLDNRFKMVRDYSSNWSERHTGYICGLGTFGMSKGLITVKGMAGRLGSVITDLKINPTNRPYNDLYDYCIKCNLCVRRCPGNAIKETENLHNAKNHILCKKYLTETSKYYIVAGKEVMKYGCGKCQVDVPCEDKIPNKKFNL